MPKLKSKSGARKRFSFTKNGKIKRNKAYSSHILTKKSRERKRKLRQGGLIHEADMNSVKKMLPYGGK